MSSQPSDNLEMQLRALGRRLGTDAPGQDLLQRVQANAHVALTAQFSAITQQKQKRRTAALYVLLVATLPVPLLFLWCDWSAVTSMFQALLPHGASSIASGIYLWLKIASVVLIYGFAVPLIALVAMRQRQTQQQEMLTT